MQVLIFLTAFVISIFSFLPVGHGKERIGGYVPHVVHLMDLRTDQDGRPLSYPSYVFVDKREGEIYVLDPGRSRIILYTEDGYPAFQLDRNRGLKAPSGVFVDEEGYIYVCQSKGGNNPRARISVFNPCLRWVRDIFIEGFECPRAFPSGEGEVEAPQGMRDIEGEGDGFF